MAHGPFLEIALILAIALAVGALGAGLRQPLIVSFIGVGILVGPAALGIVSSHEQIELLASVGIALLLFVVGLKLDVAMIRTVGPVALATGIGQVVFTSVIGFGITLALGFPPLAALYIAVALTFSSTIIIVKLLSDKREIDALHGRIAVGFLIVQDIAVILVMIGLTALGAGMDDESGGRVAAQVVRVGITGVVFLGALVVLMRWGLPQLVARLARSPELLVLFSIAWAVALAALGESLGFSREVGAFLAGVAIASTPYREAVAGRLVTVRDFLLLFFFIDLGARLDLSVLGATVGPSVVLSAFVLIGNPLIVMVIMGAMGYRKRTGFLAGLTVAQISEFSLILGALGLSLGHIDARAMGLITFVGLLTIGLSTYLILYSAPIYERLAPWLGIFERTRPYREGAADTHERPPAVDVILFGLGRYGGGIARHLLRRQKRVLGVDFDPGALRHWREAGIPVVYGDAEDPELFEHLPLDQASWVVSTAPDVDTGRVLLRHLDERGYRGKVAVACRVPEEEDTLRIEGASVILRPFADAAEQAVDALTTAMDDLGAVAEGVPGLRELRLAAGSTWAGRTIAELRIRERFRVTVLAVSRAGQSVLNPAPDHRMFPGDRVILSGEPDGLREAMAHASELDVTGQAEGAQDFAVGEVDLAGHPAWVGQTLAQLELRNRFGVTVAGIKRPGGDIAVPTADSVVHRDDRLVVAGRREDVERLQGPPAG
ncbi:MAG: cation:proton antiporter [Acidobacteria bacterium]|nr:cation:proton antiporter [Acidobacteriota bacterium]